MDRPEGATVQELWIVCKNLWWGLWWTLDNLYQWIICELHYEVLNYKESVTTLVKHLEASRNIQNILEH